MWSLQERNIFDIISQVWVSSRKWVHLVSWNASYVYTSGMIEGNASEERVDCVSFIEFSCGCLRCMTHSGNVVKSKPFNYFFMAFHYMFVIYHFHMNWKKGMRKRDSVQILDEWIKESKRGSWHHSWKCKKLIS